MKKSFKQLFMEHKVLLLLTGCIILLHTAAGVILWDRLPDRIATHFGFNNEPDGWTGKGFTVFGMPLVLLFLHVVALAVSSAENGQMRNLHGKAKYLFWWIVPAVSLLMSAICYGYALGMAMNIGRVVLLFVGVLFAVTGNYMPKVRRNYSVGIKLPWTIADDENWNRTHRMAAPIWVVCGMALIVCGLTGCTNWFAGVIIGVMIFAPTVYSLALHLKKKNQ